MSFVANVEPTKGDIIRVRRDLGYCHFGIYIGKGNVVHFSADKDDSILDNTHISIREATLDDLKTTEFVPDYVFKSVIEIREAIKK